MKKADFYKKINRNNINIFNHVNRQSPCNVESPNMCMDPIWISDGDATTGVQIIELDSSDNPQTSSDEEEELNNLKHAWNHVYNESLEENQSNNEASRNARERRRMKSRCQYTTNDYDRESTYRYYGTDSNDIRREDAILNHQMNCFTILDNHYRVNPDSSSDEKYAKVEEIQQTKCDNTVVEYNWNVNDEDTIAYEPDLDMEKRTIWIYSYKNRRLLSDDFELVNIPSRDASSTSSSQAEIEGPMLERKCVARAATPIPSSYVPRLVLPITPILPTVTEVTEPKRAQSSANQTEQSPRENVLITQKPVNNWVLNGGVTPSGCTKKPDEIISVIDWMALSPREKRRKFRNASPNIIKLPTLKEVSSIAEDNTQCHEQSIGASQRDVVAEINVPVEGINSARTNSNELASRESDEEYTPEDRGDYNKTKRYSYKTQIHFSPKPASIFSVMTEQTETHEEGDHWYVKRKRPSRHIDDETEYVGTRSLGVHGDCAGDTLLIRNMSLLRPARWAEYLPLTGSRPSLPPSSDTGSELESQSWLTRLAKCLRCCK